MMEKGAKIKVCYPLCLRNLWYRLSVRTWTQPFHNKCWNSWGNYVVLELNCVVPHSQVIRWNSTTKEMFLVMGPLEDNWVWVGSQRWDPHDGINFLIRDTENMLPPSPICKHLGKIIWGHSRRRQSVTQGEGSPRQCSCWHLDLGLLISRTARTQFL